MKNIAIFASGSGTNAQNIINYFSKYSQINIALILSNNPNAYVLQRAKEYDIKHHVFNKNDIYNTNNIISLLERDKIDLIVLAGFLWMIPENIISAYPNKIINIHPALLPKYGGKNMYGMNVHKAVKDANEKETGISIHYVNSNYDEGTIIFQAKCPVESYDTPESIAEKVHKLEYKHFPEVIAKVINSMKK